MKQEEGVKKWLKDYANGGKTDALRHVFYMAAFAQKIKATKVKRLGQAHERGNYRQFLKSQFEDGEIPDSLSTVMDLKNNEAGIALGLGHKKADLTTLFQLSVEKINSGEAVIVKRNQKGQYLSCEGKIIEPGAYKGKWYIPKCLVNSNAD